jgi:hypothetical protein
MRLWLLVCLSLCVSASSSATGQLSSPSSFQLQAQSAVVTGKSIRSVNLSANAEWFAGSQHESGTATLQASVDGSSSVQLNLGSASRTETQTKAGASRTCYWTDGAETSHNVVGPDCLIAIPWFAPSLFTQSPSQFPSALMATDDGAMSRDSQTFHQISYRLNLDKPNSSNVDRLTSMSTVKVFYDPQTFLPASLEYFIHPDTNDLQSVDVRVIFSNYQSSSGVMLPFHIEKYVNRTLQLKLDVTSVSIE